MKTDSTKTMAIISLIVTAAAATFAWTGCDSDDEGAHAKTGGGHSSPYPSCNEITSSCHEVDTGEGEIHDCHDKAHAAKSEADCTGMKARCLQVCAEARADAGSSDDGGHGGDAGQ